MRIAHDMVVSFDYELSDDDGSVIDASGDEGPMTYLHGHGQIVPGLEKELAGKQAGDHLKVVVPPADGYGERSEPPQVIRVDRSELPDDLEPEEGMGIASVDPNGDEILLWVSEVQEDAIVLSPDHPLAGMALHFDVTVREVRMATHEEIAHGHVHGDDGHDHGHE
ncbi:MAG: peptidylprolyl isomerase [Deltaproteobacteria bacterium]|nr:peptidylprolyl isomerase [Deltaproteobacteria bacterium]